MNKKNVFAIGLLGLLLFIFLHRPTRSFLSDTVFFLYALIRHPQRIGAIIPSSPFLADEIVKHIKKKNRPIKILEVGAGTGAFTGKIIEKMTQQDTLDVVELDVNLCNILRKKFKKYKNVAIHCVSILDFRVNGAYDFIISGLPFNSFDSELVFSIIDSYRQLIKNNGIISYFEYLFAANIRRFFSTGAKRANFVKNMQILENFRKSYLFEQNSVLINVPAAYVYHLQIKK